MLIDILMSSLLYFFFVEGVARTHFEHADQLKTDKEDYIPDLPKRTVTY